MQIKKSHFPGPTTVICSVCKELNEIHGWKSMKEVLTHFKDAREDCWLQEIEGKFYYVCYESSCVIKFRINPMAYIGEDE